MVRKLIRIGTRESQLAVWQATTVSNLLQHHGYESELVYIKSEGDTDLKTPLYEIGVQGIFTKALDIALLNNEIDIAVHSLKDVPTVMAKTLMQAAVLPRASHYDILVPGGAYTDEALNTARVLATSSIRRKAQWLNRYSGDTFVNLRGNVNTRLRKVAESDWHGAIFAAAGLERINVKPDNAITLDWMLPAPAQGAVTAVCRENDSYCIEACAAINDDETALCTSVERDFLRALMGGCTTPISAYARVAGNQLVFDGSLLSKDGKTKEEIHLVVGLSDANELGFEAGREILANGGQVILDSM